MSHTETRCGHSQPQRDLDGCLRPRGGKSNPHPPTAFSDDAFDVAGEVRRGYSQLPIMSQGSVSVKKMASQGMLMSLNITPCGDSLITRNGTALQPAGQLQGCSELIRLGQLTSMVCPRPRTNFRIPTGSAADPRHHRRRCLPKQLGSRWQGWQWPRSPTGWPEYCAATACRIGLGPCRHR